MLMFMIFAALVVIITIYVRKQMGFGNIPKLKKPPVLKISYSKLKPSERPKVTNSDELAALFRQVWSSQIQTVEEFYVLAFDSSNRALGYFMLGRGGITRVIMDKRYLFGILMQSLAVSFAIAHNHPSGHLKVSLQDVEFTRRIKELSVLHEIAFIDHIILTKEGHYSMADAGLV